MRRGAIGWVVVSLSLHAAVGAWALRRHGAPPAVSDTVIEIDPGAVLSGETFEVPAEVAPEAVRVTEAVPDLAGGPTDTAARKHVSGATPSEGAGTSTTETEPKLFGAVGERGAVDLATAFGRGFSQAASSDPAWLGAPLGDAGRADVTLEIDESGTLVRADVGPGASPALDQGLRRAIALVKGRTFTSPRSIVVLRVAARVSPDTVHDHFEIGVADDGRGAHFVRPETHRRVDLDIGP